MTMPCRWREGGLGDFAGKVQLVRRFGIPRRLDPHERVWLTFAGVAEVAEVSLNSQFLGRREGSAGPIEFEVTALLSQRNTLTVLLEAASGDGGLWGEVALEIRATAFLRGCRLNIGPPSTVTGQAVGTAERALDLYLLIDGATKGYATVEPLAAGQEFQVTCEQAPQQGSELSLELVNGGVVWDRITLGGRPG
jgi:hypothetical protein